jgi:integrase/recombinase XerD
MEMDLKSFEADLRLQGLAACTIKGTKWDAHQYLAWCASQGYDPLDPDLRLYLQHLKERGLKYGTIRNSFTRLSCYFEYLIEEGRMEQNPAEKFRKRYIKKYKETEERRKIISIEEAKTLVRATIDTRDRAILLLLLKTGIRRNELVTLDVRDLDMADKSLMLKPTAKRSNRLIFFDDEAARALQRWLNQREKRYIKSDSLFLNNKGQRLKSEGVDRIVRIAAERVGLYIASKKLEDRFTPHCCRHWNATHLLKAGMPREHVKWLRGDAMKEAIDIYNHIEPEDVKKSYLVHVPQLGV